MSYEATQYSLATKVQSYCQAYANALWPQAGLATREWSEEEQKAAAKIQAGERGKKIRKKGKAPKWARSERYTCGEMVPGLCWLSA